MSMYYVDDFDRDRYKQLKGFLLKKEIPDSEGRFITAILDNAPMYISDYPDDYCVHVNAILSNPHDYGIIRIHISQALFNSKIPFDKCELTFHDNNCYVEPIDVAKQTLETI